MLVESKESCCKKNKTSYQGVPVNSPARIVMPFIGRKTVKMHTAAALML